MAFSPAHILFLSLSESAVAFYFFPHVFPFSTLTGIVLLFSFINWAIFLVYKIIVYPLFLCPFRHLPQPPNGSYPIIGHGWTMFTRPPGNWHLRMMKETPNDGVVYFRSFLNEDRLLLTRPSSIAEVLVHKPYDFEKPPWVRTFLRQFLGDGLLIAEGDEHKHQRKQIMPAFSFRHIKELYPVFWSKSIELCEVVKRELWERPGGVLEIGHFSTQVTMDIIGMAGLGRDIGSLRTSEDQLIQTYEEILEPSREKGIYFVLHLILPPALIKALPWRLNERVRITASNLNRICKEFVQEKRARLKMGSEVSVDILSVMMRSETFSDDGLVDQLLTFLAAGHETTSSALTWATYLLSTHPKVQSQLRSEIHTQIPDPKALSEPNFDIATLLESMPYLNAICNEVLRLYPSIPSSARVASRDTSINGQFVPKGTLSFITPWATNRDPNLWGPDSEKFVPERWIDKETGKATAMGGAESNYSFITFLHGPRSCIGERFARAELRSLLAAFVGNFEMEMADPNEMVLAGGTITSKPVPGMRLRLKPVAWEPEAA